MESEARDLIERGFTAITTRFDERGRQFETLSNELTRVSSNVEHLQKSLDKMETSSHNWQSLRSDVDKLKEDLKEERELRKRNSWYVTTSLVAAVISLLAFLGSVVWRQVIK